MGLFNFQRSDLFIALSDDNSLQFRMVSIPMKAHSSQEKKIPQEIIVGGGFASFPEFI
jgi:hypothetical protein